MKIEVYDEDVLRVISCKDCDEEEDLFANESRHHYNLFDYDYSSGQWRCNSCNSTNISETFEDKEND